VSLFILSATLIVSIIQGTLTVALLIR
jgi:hypothetical protein